MKKYLLTLIFLTGLAGFSYSQTAEGLLAMASVTQQVTNASGFFSEIGQDDGAVVFYPNPVKDVLNVRFPQKGHHTVRVFNIIGEKISEKTVYDTEIVTLNLSEVQRGMYFVSFEMNGKIVTKTFSKQ